MKIKHILILTIGWLGLNQEIFAQSEIVGLLPMQYIPSFAGSAGVPRVVTLGRYKSFPAKGYPTIQEKPKEITHLTYLSFDHFIPKIGSGVGVSISYLDFYRPETSADYSRMRTFKTFIDLDTLVKYQRAFNTSIVLSPKISLKGKYTISPALQVNYNHLTFTENIFRHDNRRIDSTITEASKLSITGSVLFNTKKYYVGLAIYSPGYSFREFNDFNWEERMHARKGFGTIQTGYTYQRKEDSKFSFSTQIAFYTSFNNRFLFRANQYSLKFRYKKIIWGIGSGLLLFAGYQNDTFSILYAQNINVWGDSNTSGFYRGEISVRYCFKKRDKTKIGII